LPLGYVDHRVWGQVFSRRRRALGGYFAGKEQILLASARSYSRWADAPRFNFKDADQQKKVGSAYREARDNRSILQDAQISANVCCSTSHQRLEVDTLRALEEALEGFAAARDHRPRPLVPRPHRQPKCWAFEGGSHVEWFEGNFQDYEKDRAKDGQDSIIPAERQVKEADA